MELLLERNPRPEAWPLAFRAAVALLAGTCIGRCAVQAAHDAAEVPHAEIEGAWTPGQVLLGCGAAAFAACAAGVLAARHRSMRTVLTIAAAAAAGFALSCDARLRSASSLRGTGGPVTFLGTVASAPRIDDGGTDLLGEHAMRDAAQSFLLDVRHAEREGHREPWEATVPVRVAGLAPLPARGTPVRVRGWFRPARAAANPGSRGRDAPGSVEVTSASLVMPLDAGPLGRALVALRHDANAALLRAQPGWAGPGTRALVAAMTTGVRLPGLTAEAAAFRDAGMSHVLAISGFNVAVLVAGAGVAAGALGAGWRLRAILAVAVAIAFLGVTEPETSVVRAGIGAALAATATLRGGQARGLGTLGAVALVTLLVDPEEAARAGFQLSYGVVAALLAVAPAVTVRWSERAERWWRRIPAAWSPGGETGAILRRAAIGACTASLVAWTVSMPIAAWHAGTANAWAAPLSIVTMPAAALATIAGVASILMDGPLPPAADLAGCIAAACAGSLRWTAHLAADAPGGVVRVGAVPWWLAATFGMAVLGGWIASARTVRIASWLGAVAIAAAAIDGRWLPGADRPGPGRLVVESLALGRGGCRLVRSTGAALVFDAGSFGSPSVGSRVVVPALAALGVRRLDACVVGSRSLSSCAAMPEVLEAFGPPCLVGGRPCIDALLGAHDGHAGDLRRAAERLRVRLVPLDVGDSFHVGDLECSVHEASHGRSGGPRTDRIVLCVRHRDWPASTPPLVLASDPKDAVATGLGPLPPPDGAASRTERDAAGRTSTKRWTADGWR